MARITVLGPICAIALGAASCGKAARQAEMTISIVGTNDLHGAVLAIDGRGGLALLDGFLRNLRAARAADHGAVLLVDAGDLFQGTLESNLNEGAAVVAAYNALGYTAAAVGNHEFDYGPVGLAAVPQSPGDDPRGALKAQASDSEESALGNLVADWMRSTSTHADVAMANGGGLRADLPAGLLTYGRLYELMPFDNQEATITLSGAELRRLVENNLRRRGSIVLLSGVTATAFCAGTELRVELRRESGVDVKDQASLPRSLRGTWPDRWRSDQ